MRLIDADALKDYYGKWSNNHTEFLKPEIDRYIDAQSTIDPESLRPKWISVEDRLPNYFEHVLINVPGDKPFTTVHEANLRKDGLWDTGLYRYDREDVTHWMPLPEPPDTEDCP